MPITPTLNVEKAGIALGLSPVSVRRMIASGRLKASRVGRSFRILESSVNELLNGGAPAIPPAESPPAAPAPPPFFDENDILVVCLLEQMAGDRHPPHVQTIADWIRLKLKKFAPNFRQEYMVPRIISSRL